jgi:MSHA biogenesis protein MshJ
MKEQFLQWQQKVDQLNQRERILIFAVAAAVVVFVLQALLIDPLLQEQALKAREAKSLQSEAQSLGNEIIILTAELEAGVNRGKQKRREQLLIQRTTLDQRIEESVVAMIPPQMMTEVLEQVLAQDGGLKLLALENLPVASIIEQDADNPTQGSSTSQVESVDVIEEDKQGLYKHRFVLTLRGNYLATVRYFEKLNELPWRFHWDSLNYEVTDYPNATITLQVHTVSRSEDWIGV